MEDATVQYSENAVVLQLEGASDLIGQYAQQNFRSTLQTRNDCRIQNSMKATQ